WPPRRSSLSRWARAARLRRLRRLAGPVRLRRRAGRRLPGQLRRLGGQLRPPEPGAADETRFGQSGRRQIACDRPFAGGGRVVVRRNGLADDLAGLRPEGGRGGNGRGKGPWPRRLSGVAVRGYTETTRLPHEQDRAGRCGAGGPAARPAPRVVLVSLRSR